ncbi:MAG: hypothetical protein KJO55_07035 [Gammaproteobacteria bacterium]|nr:hypothetical protein [Gammaproteobacteria bacterium]
MAVTLQSLGLFLILCGPVIAGSIEDGDYIALHATVIGCAEGVRVVDIAVVDDGKADVLGRFEIEVNGLNHQQITERIATAIENETGRAPQSLHVSIVSSADKAALSRLAIQALVSRQCEHVVPEPGKDINQASPPNYYLPPPEKGLADFIRQLA